MGQGTKVRSRTFPEKGTGTAINVRRVFSQSYAEVFFEIPPGEGNIFPLTLLLTKAQGSGEVTVVNNVPAAAQG